MPLNSADRNKRSVLPIGRQLGTRERIKVEVVRQDLLPHASPAVLAEHMAPHAAEKPCSSCLYSSFLLVTHHPARLSQTA
jgi:hypothetical protein